VRVLKGTHPCVDIRVLKGTHPCVERHLSCHRPSPFSQLAGTYLKHMGPCRQLNCIVGTFFLPTKHFSALLSALLLQQCPDRIMSFYSLVIRGRRDKFTPKMKKRLRVR
jgi:hypothetical protein